MIFSSYTWSKDSKVLDDSLVKTLGAEITSEGDLKFATPSELIEGFYQCAASNKFGKALSVRTLLKQASKSSILK